MRLDRHDRVWVPVEQQHSYCEILPQSGALFDLRRSFATHLFSKRLHAESLPSTLGIFKDSVIIMAPLNYPGQNSLVLILLLLLSVIQGNAMSMEFTGHHGGVIISCKEPEFYGENPRPDATLALLEKISFTASDNTLPESIEVLINLKPVKTEIVRNRNQTLGVSANLPAPLTQGRAWIKVTAYSDDGCQQLHTWNVYVKPER